MQIDTRKLGDNKLRLDIVVPAKDMTSYVDRAFSVLAAAGQVKIEEGQTAKESVEKVFGEEGMGDLLENVIMNSMAPLVISQEHLRYIVVPEFFTEDNAAADKDFKFSMLVHTKPLCALSSYEPVEVQVPKSVVSQEEVDAQLDYVAQGAAKKEGDELIVPEITDAWVQENIKGCSTVAEFRERLERDMLTMKKREIEQYRSFMAASKLAERLDVEIDDEVYELALKETKQAFEAQLLQQGLKEEEFLKRQNLTKEQFEEMRGHQVREQLKQGLALDALAAHLGFVVTQEDRDRRFASMAPGREIEAQTGYEESGRMFIIDEMVLRAKATAWLEEHLVVTER